MLWALSVKKLSFLLLQIHVWKDCAMEAALQAVALGEYSSTRKCYTTALTNSSTAPPDMIEPLGLKGN